MHVAVRLSQLRSMDRNGTDELGRLRSITPPPDVTGTGVTALAAVVLVPLVTAAATLILHPLTFAPHLLVPVLVAPAALALVLARVRALDAIAGVALAAAAAASTFFYLCLFAAVAAIVRAVGSLAGL